MKDLDEMDAVLDGFSSETDADIFYESPSQIDQSFLDNYNPAWYKIPLGLITNGICRDDPTLFNLI